MNTEEKIIIPKSRITSILQMSHDHMLAGHLGVAKTIARVKRQYYWPSLIKDVTAYVTTCIVCARLKAVGSSKAPLHPMPPFQRVWEQIAMDVVGPVPESRGGNTCILVLSDYASRFAITIPMENQKAHTVAKHLVESVITKYGAPEKVLTDQGTNFLSKLIKDICTLFKIKQIRTTSYHPQTDGLVERFNRTLCDMLACYVNDQPELWDEYLPFVTLAHNTSIQMTMKESPFYLFFGGQPILPKDISIRTSLDDNSDLYTQQWKQA